MLSKLLSSREANAAGGCLAKLAQDQARGGQVEVSFWNPPPQLHDVLISDLHGGGMYPNLPK